MAKKKKHELAQRHGKGSPKSAKESWLKFDTKTKSILAIIGIIILALAIAYSNKMLGADDSPAVASVNGHKITSNQLDDEYNKLVPQADRQTTTKEDFLNDTMITEQLILDEADSRGIKASSSEAEEYISTFLNQSGMTKDDLNSQLAQQGMDYSQFLDFYSKRLRIIKLLNETLGIPNVTDEEVRKFYDENKASFVFGNETAQLKDMEIQIRSYLANKQQQQEIIKYIENLRKSSDISMYPENIVEAKAPGSSFISTGDPICYENGKPKIILFSTTTCPHCNWIKNTFDSVVKEYVSKGQIAAYHWQVDTGDDTLTAEAEKTAPSGDLSILQKYNSQGGVPFFVFGCRYVRIGNAYEAENDLVSEENEFRTVIESLLSAGNAGQNETTQ